MEERRRNPRRPVSWLVRLWLHDTWFTVARTVDASPHGICVAISQRVPAHLLKPGEPYRIEIRAEPEGEYTFVGELRHVTERGVGLRIVDKLPFASAVQPH